jgi:hypothetical protein
MGGLERGVEQIADVLPCSADQVGLVELSRVNPGTPASRLPC